MGFGEYKRFTTGAGALAAALCVGACDGWSPDLDPPRVVQIACRLDGAAPDTRVYVLDTGARSAVQANASEATEGRLVVMETAYRLVFAAGEIEVNRFDGRMTEETGHAPFLKAGPAPKGNQRRMGTCAAQAEGPKF